MCKDVLGVHDELSGEDLGKAEWLNGYESKILRLKQQSGV
jgi:hypothetical protein